MIRVENTVTLTDLPIICWDNVVTTSNVAAESETGFPDTNVANPSTSLKWKLETSDSPVTAMEYFRVDTTSARTINYVAIAGHNFSSANLQVGLELASYNSPVGTAEVVFEQAVPSDDGPLVFIFADREVEEVRISITTGATAPEIAVIYVGTYTQLDEGIQPSYSPLVMARVSDVVSGRSENGQFLGRIVTGSQLQSTVSLANMESTFFIDEMLPFMSFAVDNPFFWLWMPSTFQDENGAAFAWLASDPIPSLDVDGYYSLDLDMRGIGAP